MPDYTDVILDTVEAFLETAPPLEEGGVQSIKFSARETDEYETRRVVTIDGQAYSVKAALL